MDNLAATNIIVRVLVATAFIYFVITTVLLALEINGAISIGKDPIFILALYGFVTQVIFGVSYIFVPGVSHTRYASYKSAITEYAFLNIGVIAFFLSMAIAEFHDLALVGSALLVLSVLIHAVNMWRIVLPKKPKNIPGT